MSNGGLLYSRPRARLLDQGPRAKLLDFGPEPPARLLDFTSASPDNLSTGPATFGGLRNVPNPADIAHVRMLMAGFGARPPTQTMDYRPGRDGVSVNRPLSYGPERDEPEFQAHNAGPPPASMPAFASATPDRPVPAAAASQSPDQTSSSPSEPQEFTLDPLPPVVIPEKVQAEWKKNDAEFKRQLENRVSMIGALQNPRVQAILDLISRPEGGTYDSHNSGAKMTNFDEHPGFGPPNKQGDSSSAAGRYQMLKRTFDGIKKQIGPLTMSEPSQDLAAAWLLKELGALKALESGNLDTAISAAAVPKGWAALPGGVQQRIDMGQAKALYEEFLRQRMGR